MKLKKRNKINSAWKQLISASCRHFINNFTKNDHLKIKLYSSTKISINNVDKYINHI